MQPLGIVAGLLIGAVVAGMAVYFILRPKTEQAYATLQNDIEERKAAAEKEAGKIHNTALRESKQIRSEAEKVVERRYQDMSRTEKRIDRRSEKVDGQAKKLEQREKILNKRQSRLDRRQNELNQITQEHREQLEKIAGMTTEDAKRMLLEDVEKESRQDMARVMREVEDEAKEMAAVKARKLVALAIQRVASDQVAEITVSVVPLPKEELKGRIIGRNGRNIRAFEQAAGVDIVVDDTPEAVTVSSFDSVRREVARRALEKLIADGRIHPARIEKLIKDAQKEVNQVIKEAGEQAAYEANVHGLHPQITKMLGRLKYRTSYGQNQLHHAVEAAKIAAVLAAELGANVEIAKMGGLLHDLGKAMDHDQEGTHAMLGAEYAKRFKVPKVVVNAIASHHHEAEQETVEAIIVEAADAISGARPGARRESLENYIKRVRTLEEIATSFPGVESAYALQAGREIRILVKPGQIDDLGAMRLSK
ncbi:MAG: ribonuclease Y, partial [Anaerolineae bacterium]